MDEHEKSTTKETLHIIILRVGMSKSTFSFLNNSYEFPDSPARNSKGPKEKGIGWPSF